MPTSALFRRTASTCFTWRLTGIFTFMIWPTTLGPGGQEPTGILVLTPLCRGMVISAYTTPTTYTCGVAAQAARMPTGSTWRMTGESSFTNPHGIAERAGSHTGLLWRILGAM